MTDPKDVTVLIDADSVLHFTTEIFAALLVELKKHGVDVSGPLVLRLLMEDEVQGGGDLGREQSARWLVQNFAKNLQAALESSEGNTAA